MIRLYSIPRDALDDDNESESEESSEESSEENSEPEDKGQCHHMQVIPMIMTMFLFVLQANKETLIVLCLAKLVMCIDSVQIIIIIKGGNSPATEEDIQA